MKDWTAADRYGRHELAGVIRDPAVYRTNAGLHRTTGRTQAHAKTQAASRNQATAVGRPDGVGRADGPTADHMRVTVIISYDVVVISPLHGEGRGMVEVPPSVVSLSFALWNAPAGDEAQDVRVVNATPPYPLGPLAATTAGLPGQLVLHWPAIAPTPRHRSPYPDVLPATAALLCQISRAAAAHPRAVCGAVTPAPATHSALWTPGGAW